MMSLLIVFALDRALGALVLFNQSQEWWKKMMCELLPFKAEHYSLVIDQEINKSIKDWAIDGNAKIMEQTDAVSFFLDGRLMVCGGISEYWRGRGHVWVVFSEEAKYHFV